jgi:hypothetical protein
MVMNFSSHIIGVIGDETWVSFVNVVAKEQSKQWMHTHSSNICQKADGNYFLGQEMVEFMQQGPQCQKCIVKHKKTA